MASHPSGSQSDDVLVVGGGVVGLSIAWALSAAGARVRLVEAGRLGEAASWAAAGMLAPWGEAGAPGPFLALTLDSYARYPEYCHDLESESNARVWFRPTGTLVVAENEERQSRLRVQHTDASAAGIRCAWLDAAQAQRQEPALRTDFGVLWFPDEAHVDNRALTTALGIAARRRGTQVVEQSRVASIRSEAGRCLGARLEDGRLLSAERTVIAAGAWSGLIEGLPRPLPLRPVVGQMLAFQAPGLLERMVHSSEVYIIQRGERVLVGATMEHVGFAAGLTAEASLRLSAGATRLLPALEDAPLIEHWAGVRPGTVDDLPLLGPDPEVHGLHYACGLFRNGILLAPALAAWARQTLMPEGGPQGTPLPDLTAFDVGRGEETDG